MPIRHIPTEPEEKRFLQHLEIPDNNQIIFSGIFGIGKSYFIKRFFEKHQDDFLAIKLNPINYAVSQNEDILEYIKYDVAFEVLRHKPQFEKLEFNKNLFREVYLKENFLKAMSILAEGASKVDQRLSAIYQSIKSLNQHIEKAQNESELDEAKEIKTYIETFIHKEGSIYEENYFTDLINGLVKSLKELYPKKKLVLVIDDLDRIDPEHIFRILNVFSVHTNYHGSGEHKLGFDKVILICDINNIRHIFHSRYGSETDFTGYIDKFYTSEIFHYQFKRIISSHVHDLFEQVETNSFRREHYIGPESYLAIVIKDILAHFFQTGALSMRSFVNLASQPFEPEDMKFPSADGFQILSSETPILFLFEYLEKTCGGSIQLKKALKRTAEQIPYLKVNHFNTTWDQKYGDLALILDHTNNEFGSGKEYHYRNKNLDVGILYAIRQHNPSVVSYAIGIGHHNSEFDPGANELSRKQDLIKKKKMPYYQLLLQAYQVWLTIKEQGVHI